MIATLRQGHVSAFPFTPFAIASESFACQLCLPTALTHGRFASSLCVSVSLSLCLSVSLSLCLSVSLSLCLCVSLSLFLCVLRVACFCGGEEKERD